KSGALPPLPPAPGPPEAPAAPLGVIDPPEHPRPTSTPRTASALMSERQPRSSTREMGTGKTDRSRLTPSPRETERSAAAAAGLQLGAQLVHLRLIEV